MAANRRTFALVSLVVVGGCYPGLPVVRPSTTIAVVDAEGRAVPDADVTIATFRQPFPFPRSTVRTTYRTNEAGVLNVKQKRKWQLQVMLPDGYGWYTWLYCVEKPGYRAVASTEIEDRIGPITVVLQPSPSRRSLCVWPSEQRPYWEVVVADE